MNLFQQLQNLLPQPSVVVGLVTAVHNDGTTTVQLPGAPGLTDYSANIFTGSLLRVRGTGVATGKRAFVRNWQTGWVLENQAPDGSLIDLPIGALVPPPPPPAVSAPVAPPPPPPRPSNNGVDIIKLRTSTATIQYLTQYRVAYPGAVGLGGTFSSYVGMTPVLSEGDMTVTFPDENQSVTGYFNDQVALTNNPGAMSAGYYAVEFLLHQLDGLDDMAVGAYPNFEINGTVIAHERGFINPYASLTQPKRSYSPLWADLDVIGLVFDTTAPVASNTRPVSLYRNGTLVDTMDLRGYSSTAGDETVFWGRYDPRENPSVYGA